MPIITLVPVQSWIPNSGSMCYFSLPCFPCRAS